MRHNPSLYRFLYTGVFSKIKGALNSILVRNYPDNFLYVFVHITL